MLVSRIPSPYPGPGANRVAPPATKDARFKKNFISKKGVTVGTPNHFGEWKP